ncbi:hypothetical protein AMJ52_02435 [candidate division TA06 bacterium DG_78]|uniref:Uncharacterized protein n=1 Tax=candidate division TA06 bacterium DG_78 TaxID=1703772 RepID=A0A0S7YH34_UNCT6|nr:MAG: hypothetical protein AMJ52_02435 [candidate division TA06 bacterium DG_78]
MNKIFCRFVFSVIYLFSIGTLSLYAQTPEIANIFPNHGINNEQTVTVHIYGDQLFDLPTLTVKLLKSGYLDIIADSNNVVSQSRNT